MFKLFFWRLSFETLEFLKFVGLEGGKDRYFAFGGNLDPKVLSRREIVPIEIICWEMTDHELVFDHQGPFEGGGFASIRPSPGNSVFGKIYVIHKIDAWRLHCFEASLFLNKYRRVRVPWKERKNFFFYQTAYPKPNLLPTKEYKESLLAGYVDYPLETKEFISTLDNWPILELKNAAKDIHFLVRDYYFFGRPFYSVLKKYDQVCFRVFLKFIWKPGFFSRKRLSANS